MKRKFALEVTCFSSR